MSRFFPPLTANKLQASTYLLGVALFSIAFLVFLNASISFIVTYIVGQRRRVGDTVGTLGFADELLALFACPLWGLISDRIGVRNVAVLGYCIVGISLFCVVRSTNVYPELLLARLAFSVGGAACSTMVTAVLPSMVAGEKQNLDDEQENGDAVDPIVDDRPEHRRPGHSRDSSGAGHTHTSSVCSELTITPQRYTSQTSNPGSNSHSSGSGTVETTSIGSTTSRLAGLVGMFTGMGALLALALFLPLPAYFHDGGRTWADSIRLSFYLVAALAFTVAIAVFIGLRNLPGEDGKSWISLVRNNGRAAPKSDLATDTSVRASTRAPSYSILIYESIKLGFTDPSIGLGYLGGFVARASSVGISLFIPLYVNHYYIRSGLCSPVDDNVLSHGHTDVRDRCEDAYKVAQALAGIAETAALICAPAFGWLGGRAQSKFGSEWPLFGATVAGVVGYTLFGMLENPDAIHGDGSSRWAFLAVVLIGVSQIGAIVRSLSLLARGIHASVPQRSGSPANVASQSINLPTELEAGTGLEVTPLLIGTSPPSNNTVTDSSPIHRTDLKGSIAGIYSFAGGAGILLLTKLGGFLFDVWSPGVPFFMLAIANAILAATIIVIGSASSIAKKTESPPEGHDQILAAGS